MASSIQGRFQLRCSSMTVFREKKCYQLGVYSFIGAEVSPEETADEVSVYRSIVTWEMDVFKTAEKAFKICSEFLYLGGFSCSVQSFKYYKHCVIR